MSSSETRRTLPGMTCRIVQLQASAKGRLVGESNPAAKHPDSIVVLARTMRARGLSSPAIGIILGISQSTIRCWSSCRRNTPALKIMLRKVAE